MYNLLISSSEDSWESGSCVYGLGRFLEYTASPIKKRFRTLSDEAISELCRLPALFAYESPIDKPARVGRITDIRSRESEIRIKFDFDKSKKPIPARILAEHAWEFDIDSYEFGRHHWAVKDVDLTDALVAAGLLPQSMNKRAEFRFSRRTILAAARSLKNLSHSALDSLLLEYGVAGLGAGRELGGLQDRSNAVGEFAIKNPDALTADGEKFASALIQRVVSDNLYMLEPSFEIGLNTDGFSIVEGKLIPHPSSAEEPIARPSANPTSANESPQSTEGNPELLASNDNAQAGSELEIAQGSILVRPSVFKVPNSNVVGDLVAVMMPFEMQFNSVYEAIKGSCMDVSLQCRRADNMWENEEIIQDIFALIYTSRIVVVDFTTRNPNVLYETGIAHTLGKPVVPIAQDISDLPFDLRHHRFLRYLNNGEGLAEMRSKLAERLRTLAENSPRQ